MARMAGPDCAVMCNLINIHTHTHTHIISWPIGVTLIDSTYDRPPLGKVNASYIE